MLSGGDVRPLALVVIGRGQITTPYILVIPSEGDYCFLGSLFYFLCSVLSSQLTINTAQTRYLSSPPSPRLVTCSLFCCCSLSWPSCLHVCSALNVAGYFNLSAFDFFYFDSVPSLFKTISHHRCFYQKQNKHTASRHPTVSEPVRQTAPVRRVEASGTNTNVPALIYVVVIPIQDET